MCVSAGVHAQQCVCWCVSYHATFASSQGQKYTAASWDKQEQIRLCGSSRLTPMGSMHLFTKPPWRCDKKKSFFKPLLSSHKQSGMRRKKIRLPKLLLWINRHSTWPFSFSIPLFNQADAERFELTGRVRRQSLITLLKHQHVLCDMKPRAVRASINLNDRCWDTQLVYDPQTSHSVWPLWMKLSWCRWSS